jgi:tetratricopeptide (TPR) repeat protein
LQALTEALGMFEALGDRFWTNETLSRLGAVYTSLGRLDQAEEALRRSLSESFYLSGAVGASAAIWLLAAVAFEREDFDRALRLMGFSQAVADRMGSTPPSGLLGDHASHIANARRTLGDEAIERLRAEGRAMSLDQAIDYAMGDSG